MSSPRKPPDRDREGPLNRTRAPFTPEGLQKNLAETIKDKSVVLPQPGKGDLERLADALNEYHRHFIFVTEIANQSKERAECVSRAFGDLEDFFAERRTACEAGDARTPAILKNEQRLYCEFVRFLKAFDSHKFELSMDAGLLMPKITGWHPYAELIANRFRTAMRRANRARIFGNSNDGPVARFVATVIPYVTGEKPSVGAVAKRLKDSARHKGKKLAIK